uniref:Uncharacterized protein n=1 Tax=Pipistrellus kuhlii TaxID=59472 RepID=A0A7J7RZX2_PIPKU|nr:hypothetical protein mPipKuh1_010212 [Pipistrellus kuhlii]
MRPSPPTHRAPGACPPLTPWHCGLVWLQAGPCPNLLRVVSLSCCSPPAPSTSRHIAAPGAGPDTDRAPTNQFSLKMKGAAGAPGMCLSLRCWQPLSTGRTAKDEGGKSYGEPEACPSERLGKPAGAKGVKISLNGSAPGEGPNGDHTEMQLLSSPRAEFLCLLREEPAGVSHGVLFASQTLRCWSTSSFCSSRSPEGTGEALSCSLCAAPLRL